MLLFIVWKAVRVLRGKESAGVCAGCKGCSERDIFIKKKEECGKGGASSGCSGCAANDASSGK